jgi:membrane protein YdbS with pleckstrin-like domain
MKIAQSITREKFPLSKRKIIKKTLVNTIIWVIFIGIPYVILAIALASAAKFVATGILTIVSLFLLLIIIALVYFYQRWYFAVYFYDLTDDYIIIKKGPITPREITIPYERVQDVYVDQDIWDRLFRLYDVHLSSATVSSGMEAHIDGVEREAADGLRALLLETVSSKISRNKNQTTNNTSNISQNNN